MRKIVKKNTERIYDSIGGSIDRIKNKNKKKKERSSNWATRQHSTWNTKNIYILSTQKCRILCALNTVWRLYEIISEYTIFSKCFKSIYVHWHSRLVFFLTPRVTMLQQDKKKRIELNSQFIGSRHMHTHRTEFFFLSQKRFIQFSSFFSVGVISTLLPSCKYHVLLLHQESTTNK